MIGLCMLRSEDLDIDFGNGVSFGTYLYLIWKLHKWMMFLSS